MKFCIKKRRVSASLVWGIYAVNDTNPRRGYQWTPYHFTYKDAKTRLEYVRFWHAKDKYEELILKINSSFEVDI